MAVPYNLIIDNLDKTKKKLLLILSDNDKLMYSSLRKALNASQRDLDIAISGIVTSGLAKRVKDLEDHRATYYCLTEHGKELIKLL